MPLPPVGPGLCGSAILDPICWTSCLRTVPRGWDRSPSLSGWVGEGRSRSPPQSPEDESLDTPRSPRIRSKQLRCTRELDDLKTDQHGIRRTSGYMQGAEKRHPSRKPLPVKACCQYAARPCFRHGYSQTLGLHKSRTKP